MYELNWIEENGKHLGFEDGALAFRVYQDEDAYWDMVAHERMERAKGFIN